MTATHMTLNAMIAAASMRTAQARSASGPGAGSRSVGGVAGRPGGCGSASLRSPATQIPEDLAGGVLARAAGDATAGVGAGAAQVQPLQRDPVAGVAEQRAPGEELVEARLG